MNVEATRLQLIFSVEFIFKMDSSTYYMPPLLLTWAVNICCKKDHPHSNISVDLCTAALWKVTLLKT